MRFATRPRIQVKFRFLDTGFRFEGIGFRVRHIYTYIHTYIYIYTYMYRVLHFALKGLGFNIFDLGFKCIRGYVNVPRFQGLVIRV